MNERELRELAERTSKAGAALLGREMDTWYLVVDRMDIRMTTTHHCILGQLYGDFFQGQWELFGGYDHERSRELGFTMSYEQRTETAYRLFLRREWVKRIEERLNSLDQFDDSPEYCPVKR